MNKKNRKKIISITLILTMCLITSTSAVFAGTSAYTTNTSLGLNGRSGPGTNYSVLLSIPPKSTVTATGNVQNGFTQIQYNGKTCWVSSSYISYNNSSSKIAYTTNTSLPLNMRASASSNAKVLRGISPYSQVTVYGNPVNGFYKASYGGTTGYISASYVSFSKPNNTTTYSDSYTQSTVKITYNGQTVDTFNGVNAIYVTGTGNSDYDTTYSCAALVARYYKNKYGITVSNMFKNATPIASKGSFTQVSSPKAGDIVYHANSSGGGHWMILKSVNSNGTYTVFEQNYKWKSNGSTYAYKNRHISKSTVSNLKFFRYNG